MEYKKIPFSPPDITEAEINSVVDVLKSGWITSGPKTMEFEKRIADYCETNYTVALNSATAGLELVLRVLNIGPGDEVITTPYTYTATASVILHRGAKPVLADVKKDSFLIDIDKIKDALTEKTKAIISVDIAGVPVDYDKIRKLLKDVNREDIALIADSAHSFGSKYKGKRVGGQMDFHVFSFHAVKNFTTAEGGAVTFNNNKFHGKEDLYKEFKYTSLHGQTKDALSKMQAGAWEYDIVTDGFKCNMTDIMAAIGLVQLDRYEGMLEKRRNLFEVYNNILKDKSWAILPTYHDAIMESCCHLYTLRLNGLSEEERNKVIAAMGEKNIATNVHFKPLPLLTLYKNLGYKIADYPNAYNQYSNEISLPLYSTLTLEDAEYVANELIKSVESIL